MATHTARITGPVPYTAPGGVKRDIPLGPCLMEQIDDRSIDIIWGAQGQRSALLPLEAIKAAQSVGSLVLLD